MIPSTLMLLIAATSTVLSANALPIFSGFFGSPAAAPLQPRDTTNLTDGQLAQGTNAFFSTLLLEDVCTPGQVACINNNTATCSPEANWEITPCPSSTTCLAIPASTDSTSQDLIVTCTNPTTALTSIEQAGGSQALAVDFNITTAPFNTTVVNDPNTSNNNSTSTDVPTTTGTDVPTATDTSGDAPTGTDDTSVPTSTCTPDDGSNDGSDDGSNDGSDDGGSTDPTGTDAASDPTATCTDDPSAEPTETEFITVIAFPDPTDSAQFSYSTLEPTETLPADVTDATDVPTPTDTDTNTDTAAPTTTDTADTGSPTTLSVPPNFSISGPVPDISALGTFEIPVTSTTVSMPVPIRRRGGMIKKVRRS